MTIDVTRTARIVFACGRPGSGKSHYVKTCIAADRPERLLVFDPEGEYSKLAHPVEQLRDIIRLVEVKRFAVSFVPSPLPELATQQFEVFCRIAFDLAQAGRTITLAVDELQQVTTPSRAPPYWAACIRRGRKYGMSIYAAAQRPAEIDKTIYSNATEIRTGALSFPDDQATIGRAIGVDPADVGALSGYQWIKRDAEGQITRG
jgi:DNA helicase HerA-like ATPase